MLTVVVILLAQAAYVNKPVMPHPVASYFHRISSRIRRPESQKEITRLRCHLHCGDRCVHFVISCICATESSNTDVRLS